MGHGRVGLDGMFVSVACTCQGRNMTDNDSHGAYIICCEYRWGSAIHYNINIVFVFNMLQLIHEGFHQPVN